MSDGCAGEPTQQRLQRVREAQSRLRTASAETRTAVLETVRALMRERADLIRSANDSDLEAARRDELATPLLRRLELGEDKLASLEQGLTHLVEGPDLLGRPIRKTLLDEGLVLEQVRSPLGVVLVIFESRPDAVIQIGSLALRTGNAVLLKGGREAVSTNRVLVQCLRDALQRNGLLPDAATGFETREAVAELLAYEDHIDLVIPRGSAELVRRIQSSTRIPVLGHADGICHVYLDRGADLEKATRIVVDAKCGYPAACNALETLLVHRELLPRVGPVLEALAAQGVVVRATQEVRSAHPGLETLEEGGWSREYLDLELSCGCVDDVDAAMRHIAEHGSAHTDSIVTEDAGVARRFLDGVDSASVFWNASTRFADGFRYGLGAEVGISTSPIHARGPVGAEGLLTTRWLLEGDGQVASDYGPGKREFLHEPQALETSPQPKPR